MEPSNNKILSLLTVDSLVLKHSQDKSFSEKTNLELFDISLVALNTISDSYEQSKTLRSSELSVRYSQLIDNVDKNLNLLKKITQLFKEREYQCSFDVEILEANYREMINNLPIGPSVFLELDLRLLESFSEVEEEKTYVSQLKDEYYNPRISQQGLYEWFEPYLKKGSYESSTCFYKENQLGRVKFNKMFTCFSLMHSSLQQRFKYREFTHQIEDESEVTSKTRLSCCINSVKSLGSFVIDSYQKSSLVLKKLRSSTIGYIATNVYGGSTIFNYQVQQVELNQNIDPTFTHPDVLMILDDVLKEKMDEWGFESFQIFNTERQIIDLGFSEKLAVAADRIIFFHKKV